MTQATKTLTVLFAFSVILAATIAFTSGRSTSESLSGPVLSFQSEPINRMTIQNRTIDNVSLVKEGSAWLVVDQESGKQYETEPNAVENALRSIENLSIQALLTRNPEQHIRYQVDDSTGTVVDLYADDELLESIVVGRSGGFGTYVRPLLQNDVYAVEGNIIGQFNKDVESWRNKTVWDIPREEIRQISFDYPADSSFTIVRIEDSRWTTASGDSIQTGASNRLINTLCRLRAQGFADESESDALDNLLYRITLTMDSGPQRTLSIAEGIEENRFIAKTDDYPFTFILGSSFQNSVLRSKQDLLENN